MIATIATPHADIELGVGRQPLRYLLRAPAAGLDGHTGLALFIVGYGMEPCGAYAQKLLAHLADRHNCVAVSVDYFGANLLAKSRLAPLPDFFLKLAQHYGICITAPADVDMLQLLLSLANLLRQNGVTRLTDECQLAAVCEEYNSMGLLPAFDGLQVTHRVLSEFPLDRRRLFVIGTSYGGYIASLMMKLAPNTFRMVVDNSGFSSADDDLDGVMGLAKVHVGGVAMVGRAVRAWSRDPASATYFSSVRHAIRDLRDRAQVKDNTACLYAYHAAADTVAPTAEKLRLRDAYDGRVHYDLSIVDATQLDGHLFKTLEHGMKASLRGLFDLSYEKFVAAGGALADHTDFDLAAEHRFPCGGEDYLVRFGATGVCASIEPGTLVQRI
jgi:pimeloyl-ACP methyl ester carboxylesterase